MRLDEWRQLLNVDHYKSRDDEDFWAVCPCHNDHEASLHVHIGGDRQIVMKCFVCGADRKSVAEALGYKLSDVAVDARTGEPPARYAARAERSREPRKGKKVRPYREGDEWMLPRGKGEDGKPEKVPFKIVRVYEYRDAQGAVVLRKARLEAYNPDGTRRDKSFAVQSTEDGGKTWVNNDGKWGALLYRADELAAACRERREVILCEGEKDADNLRALGYTATTAQHGAGSGRNMEGKWSSEQTQALEGCGAVTLLPDNDQVGESFMQYVASQLYASGIRCRVVHIADAWPDIPKKADFTDWALDLKGRGVGRAELVQRLTDLITMAPDWNPDGVPVFTVGKGGSNSPSPGPIPVGGPEAQGNSTRPDRAKSGKPDGEDGQDKDWDDYHGLKAYGVKWGKLCAIGKNGASVIADFVPTLTETIQRDDGQDISMEFTVSATIGEGDKARRLKDARVLGVSKLKAMDWTVENWGAYGRVAPGSGTPGKVYDAILRAGQKTSQWRTIYGHTGVAIIDGKPCYLYNGGAIGADGVSVELKNNLRYYDLTDEGVSAEDGARATWALAQALPDRVILPLLAQAYLAPVYSVLEEMDAPPSYVVYVAGETGAYKSTVVSYVMAHFGRFYNRRFPATFEDTANSARDKTFIVKDALYVVDDYNPQNDRRAMARMDGVANTVITAIADRAERGGLTATKDLREERPARCTCIMTGEQLPNLGQGRVLRLYVINVAPGELAQSPQEQLRPFAEKAGAGYYRASMRGYISRLLERWDGIKKEISARLDRCQQVADAFLDRRWGRMGHAASCLLLGCDLMVEHLQALGVIEAGPEAYHREIMRCWRAIEANIRAQTDAIAEATPARMWLSALRSLTRTQQVAYSDLMNQESVDKFLPNKVGWMDDRWYYLEADMADKAVRQLWKDSGQDVGMSNKQIHRQLLEMGLLLPGTGPDGKPTPGRAKSIGGKTRRVLWIPRDRVDREEGEEELEEVHDEAPAQWVTEQEKF
ncbi:MAG: hypothetical protein IJ573_00640 [Clostridia bacterium]|nr:hypothetical protein [Clostridia bacterium]